VTLEEIAAEVCLSCSAPLRPGAAFCVRCGAPRVLPAQGSFGDVSFVLRFYVAMLLVHGAVAGMVALDVAPFTVDVAGTSLWAAVTVVAALLSRDVLAGLYRTLGFPPRTLLLIAGASLPIYVLVDAYVDVLSRWMTFLRVPDDPFAGASPIWPVIFVCAFPAIFEEMGFRGVIFGRLARSLRLWEAVLISSFAFAILHLSFFSLVTHLPLGLYFCALRHRSGSLAPSMIAHFLHNFWSVLDSRWDWFTFV